MPCSVAIILRLNQPEEMKPITPVTPENQVDTATAKTPAAAGSKKPEPAKPAGKK